MVLGTLALVWEAWKLGVKSYFSTCSSWRLEGFNLLVSVVWMWVPGQPMRRIIEVETYFFLSFFFLNEGERRIRILPYLRG